MYDHLKLGLARFVDFFSQKQIEQELSGSFNDLHEDIHCFTQNLRRLEEEINAVLYGERPAKTSAAAPKV